MDKITNITYQQTNQAINKTKMKQKTNKNKQNYKLNILANKQTEKNKKHNENIK